MKNILAAIIIMSSILVFSSCKKDEGELPSIGLKSGSGYISKNDTLAVKSSFRIGVNAAKAEDKDVLKKFNISKSINGGSAVSVLSKDLSSSEEDNFSFDFDSTVDSTVGQSTLYRFTVTNRDGLTNSVSVTIVGK